MSPLFHANCLPLALFALDAANEPVTEYVDLCFFHRSASSLIPSSSIPLTLALNSRNLYGGKLYEDVQGTCSGKHGYVGLILLIGLHADVSSLPLRLRMTIYADIWFSYIIAVLSINSTGEGKVLPSTGQARFRCAYTAIVMKPFKGEVVDGKVANVNKVDSRRITPHVCDSDADLCRADGLLRDGRTITGLRVVTCELLSQDFSSTIYLFCRAPFFPRFRFLLRDES